MDYKERISKLLEENMTEKGFKLWKGIDSILPDIWNKPTSSTGKHHKKMNGEIPSQAEHVYQMLYCCIKLFRMFNVEKNTSEADKLLFSISLHDSLKYGEMGSNPHSYNEHDRAAANMIETNKDTFLKVLDETQFNSLVESVRFHMGRWSTEAKKNPNFTFSDFYPETFFVHILDMLSTADLIQTDIRE